MKRAGVRPLLILGVSGATWDVLSPLEQQGRTPNISRLLGRGTGARLSSVKAPSVFFGDVERRALLLRKMKLEVSRDIFINLYRGFRPDLAAFVTFYVDFVSHRYWRYGNASDSPNSGHRELAPYAGVVDRAYEAFDRVVGDLVAA